MANNNAFETELGQTRTSHVLYTETKVIPEKVVPIELCTQVVQLDHVLNVVELDHVDKTLKGQRSPMTKVIQR
jgi:hypothetical protein